MGQYDAAQLCLNGHLINAHANRFRQQNSQYCPKCGAATLLQCGSCQTPIRGGYWEPEVIAPPSHYEFPSFCPQCGQSYPWTEARVRAAKELALELEELTEEERTQMTESLEELVRDTPQTAVSAMRFKKLLAKAGQDAAEAFKEVLMNVLTRGARRLIWP